jgi:hypothetical protein
MREYIPAGKCNRGGRWVKGAEDDPGGGGCCVDPPETDEDQFVIFEQFVKGGAA